MLLFVRRGFLPENTAGGNAALSGRLVSGSLEGYHSTIVCYERFPTLLRSRQRTVMRTWK
jgi:hypothetical protein